jgi:hypothetical protein
VIPSIICSFHNTVLIYLTILIDLKTPTNKMLAVAEGSDFNSYQAIFFILAVAFLSHKVTCQYVAYAVHYSLRTQKSRKYSQRVIFLTRSVCFYP